jgi:hypothetical protein
MKKYQERNHRKTLEKTVARVNHRRPYAVGTPCMVSLLHMAYGLNSIGLPYQFNLPVDALSA